MAQNVEKISQQMLYQVAIAPMCSIGLVEVDQHHTSAFESFSMFCDLIHDFLQGYPRGQAEVLVFSPEVVQGSSQRSKCERPQSDDNQP